MVVVCGVSAWQYWRTPPVLRAAWLDDDPMGDHLEIPAIEAVIARPLRKNAREADRLVQSHLLTDLKGVSLPVRVYVDERSSAHAGDLVEVHQIPRHLPSGCTISLGNGLSVLQPEYALLLQNDHKSVIDVAKMMYEACGIFSLLPSNPRLDFALGKLIDCGIISKENSYSPIYGYSDERGKPLSLTDAAGRALPWTPTFDRKGRLTDLWKRPPLTSVEGIEIALGRLSGIKGLGIARKALEITMDGAASPEEVRACLLLCSGTWNGGESWDRPYLNRRVLFGSTAQALAHQRFCIGDLLWPEAKGDLEVQSESFHADEQGFFVQTGRRAALESMGYAVLELTHEQMTDLDQLEALLPAYAERLGFELNPRTVAFLRRRDSLLGELSKPYDPE